MEEQKMEVEATAPEININQSEEAKGSSPLRTGENPFIASPLDLENFKYIGDDMQEI